jgi:hypothetical protein
MSKELMGLAGELEIVTAAIGTPPRMPSRLP